MPPIVPLHLGLVGAGKVIRSLAGGMEHFNDFLSVFLRAPAVSLQSRACDDGVARERGGCEGVALRLTPETVEDKVWQEDEISLGGGGL